MSLLQELYTKLNSLNAQMAELRGKWEAAPDDGVMERMNNVKSGIVATERAIADERNAESTAALQTRMAEGHVHFETTDPPPPVARINTDSSPAGQARDAALHLVEERSGELSAAAADHLDTFIRRDNLGVDARLLIATGDPHYERAWFKRVFAFSGPERELTREEQAALQRVGQVTAELRAMGIAEGKIGQYATPFALDPTVNLTSNGSVNPIRSLARVVPVNAREWRGITSAGIEAGYGAEAEQAEDNSPELAQPTVPVERGFAWVPFSYELSEDWSTLREELARLFADAKDQVEAVKFLTGEGAAEHEPYGLLTGAEEIVESKEEGKLGVEDAYDLIQAIPPRFSPNCTIQTSLTIANTLYRATGPGSEEPSLFNDAGDRMLKKRWYENSHMSAEVKSEELVAVAGDMSNYLIAERVGSTVIPVNAVFGANQRPTGQAGLYLWFRNGAKVLTKAAFRVLEVK